jgi:hypothetical protein
LTDEKWEKAWDYMRLRAGDESAGRTPPASARFNWSSEDRELFSELAERYVRAVCVLLAESMADVAMASILSANL